MGRREVRRLQPFRQVVDPRRLQAHRGIEDLARDLAHEGIGVVWVSHDLSQVQRIADRVEVLIDGRNATPAETLEFLNQETEGEQ